MRWFALFSLLPLACSAAPFSGRVVDRLGEPVPDATVVLLAPVRTATTDTAGFFTLDLPDEPVTLRVTALSGETVTAVASPAESGPWSVTLPLFQSGALALDTVVVLPSRFPVGDAPGSQMRTVEALLTPGSLADINRALQTLPGVDSVDEGDALYVRGGDAFETGVFINGSRYQQVRDEEAPTGTFVGSISPFLAESIRFEAGGFGARYGDALSGIVAIETLGRPDSRAASVNVGLGALSAGIDVPLSSDQGLRVTGTLRDVRPIFALNGSARSFARAPYGHDASVLWSRRFSPTAEAKVFVLDQTNRFAVHVTERSGIDVYRSTHRRTQGWASSSFEVAGHPVRLDASFAATDKTENKGAWTWRDQRAQHSISAQLDRRLGEQALVAGGIEASTTRTHLEERYASWRGTERLTPHRFGAWIERDAMLTPRLRAVTGLRVDASNLGGGITADPRLALGYKLSREVSLSAAWGLYHQRPDAVLLSSLRASGPRVSQQATHAIVSIDWIRGKWQQRWEVYQKDYERLVLPTADRRVREGEGHVHGLDYSARFPLPARWTGRVSASVTRSRRTEVRSGQIAPYGVGFSSALIVQREFGEGYQLGLTWRQAAGKAYTPILGSEGPDTEGAWRPLYGAPNSARLRPLQRLDLLLTRLQTLSPNVQAIYYLSVSNVLGHSNQYDVSYSPDYQEATPVRSILNRIIYVGFSLTFR